MTFNNAGIYGEDADMVWDATEKGITTLCK
jgi:hypothetical protein